MDIESILMILMAKWPVVGFIVMILGVLVVAGQALVVLTPTKKDDIAWEKIKAIPVLGQLISAIVAFAPIQKK